ncbi:MAG: hypothetical protein KFW09_03620 [Oscillospiraceae bacterium]|nr:hypothetical protein [Oscillospiraceae bacterium]
MFSNKRKRVLDDPLNPNKLVIDTDYDSDQDETPSPKRVIISSDSDDSDDDDPNRLVIDIDSDSDSDSVQDGPPSPKRIIIDSDSDESEYNQPSTSTAYNQPSTSTAYNQPSTSTAHNQPSTSTAYNQLNDSLTAYAALYPVPDSDWQEVLSFLNEDSQSSSSLQDSTPNSPYNFPTPSLNNHPMLVEIDPTIDKRVLEFKEPGFFSMHLNSVFNDDKIVTVVKSGDNLPPPPTPTPRSPSPPPSPRELRRLAQQEKQLKRLKKQQKEQYKRQNRPLPPQNPRPLPEPMPESQLNYPIPEYPTPDTLTSDYMFSYILYIAGCVNNTKQVDTNYFPNDNELCRLVEKLNIKITEFNFRKNQYPKQNINDRPINTSRTAIMAHLKTSYLPVYPCVQISDLTKAYPYNLTDEIFFLHEDGLPIMVQKIKGKIYTYNNTPQSTNLSVQNKRFTTMSRLTVTLNIAYRKIYNLPPITNT